MAERYDAVVVGGGIIGSAVALELSLAGRSTLLIDDKPKTPGASWGNAAGIATAEVVPMASPALLRQLPALLLRSDGPLRLSPSYAVKEIKWFLRFLRGANRRDFAARSRVLAQLCARALDDTDRLLELCGRRDILQRRGSLRLYRDEAQFRAALPDWLEREALGAEIEVVGRPEIRALARPVAQDYAKGVLLRTHYYIRDPADFLAGITSRFRSLGGMVREDRVVRLDGGEDHASVQCRSGGEVRCDVVVVSAGAASAQLARQAGDALPVIAERGYHVQFEDPGVEIDRIVGDPALFAVATPLKQGLRVTGFSEFRHANSPPIAGRLEVLRRAARRLFPGLQDDRMQGWVGARPAVPDSIPIVGRSVASGRIVYCCGHGHLGLTFAATSAALVAGLVAGQPEDEVLAQLAPRRFSR